MRHLWGAAGALILGLSFATPVAAQQGGFGQAQPQADGCPAECPMHAEGGEDCTCPGHGDGKGAHAGACPMTKAKNAGVTAKVEETERGATIRLEGPRGDARARDEARASAQRVARMMEEGCPHGAKADKAAKPDAAGKAGKAAKAPPAGGG